MPWGQVRTGDVGWVVETFWSGLESRIDHCAQWGSRSQ